MKVRGIVQLPSKRWRVQKYGVHLGVYDTYNEAVQVVKDAEEYRKIENAKV